MRLPGRETSGDTPRSSAVNRRMLSFPIMPFSAILLIFVFWILQQMAVYWLSATRYGEIVVHQPDAARALRHLIQ